MRIGFVIAFALWAIPASAQVPVRWKLAAGDVYWFEGSDSNRADLKSGGNEWSENEQSRFVISFEVLKVLPDGGAVVRRTVEKMFRVDGNVPGFEIERMQGCSLTATLDGNRRTTKIEGIDAMVDRLARDNDDLKKALRTRMTEENLKPIFDGVFSWNLPEKPVAAGSWWTASTRLKLGDAGTVVFDEVWFHVGNTFLGSKAYPTFIANVSARRDPPVPGGPLLKIDTKFRDFVHTFQFDVDRGRMQYSQLSGTEEGSFTVDVAGTPTPVQAKVKYSQTMRRLDKKPE